jgi:RNA polymerase sigma factor (sigma-70 family)
MQLKEIELIQDLIDGKQNAYLYLLKEYEKKVFNLCLSFIPNNNDAEDIAQEVFIQIFNSISQFKQNSKLSTWIYSIAKNKSLDFIRSQKAKKRDFFKLNIFSDQTEKFDNYFVEFNHGGVQLEEKQNAEVLFKAINLLPENQKTAFTLHKIDQLSYEEVAKIMNCTISSVESFMFRAKGNLKKILKNYYNENF